ncbi:MAG: NAD-dependent protein deacetylase [Gammaproteobacteria bacterium]|nr:NAD-dependent protein deacetylase [Gammaproteobacteria bacterium]
MKTQPDSLTRFIRRANSLVVLSGAGVSTASGIPDYRGRNGEWKHARPVQYGEFKTSAATRRRYWSRSHIGWQRFSGAQPNDAHRALATLEAIGKVDVVVTQNVDRLHSEAGSNNVIDLHGDLSKVRCIDCNSTTSRSTFQERLRIANPDWHAVVVRYQADGDADLHEYGQCDFVAPECEACGGIIKPDVVMFGENVPRKRVDDVFAAIDQADALLVVGSSLMVYSGFRFARHANEQQKPLAIVNQGQTRADDIATVKFDADCVTELSAAAEELAG